MATARRADLGAAIPFRQMQLQRICPKCGHMNLVTVDRSRLDSFFTCRCGTTLQIAEWFDDTQVESRSKPTTTRNCPKCKRNVVFRPSETTKRCTCGTRISAASGLEITEDAHAPLSPKSQFEVTCFSCGYVNTVSVQRVGTSTYFSCRCGRVLSTDEREREALMRKREQTQVLSRQAIEARIRKVLNSSDGKRAEQICSHWYKDDQVFELGIVLYEVLSEDPEFGETEFVRSFLSDERRRRKLLTESGFSFRP